MSEPVLVREPHDHVVVLRLNRPEKRNALDMALMSAIGSALAAAEDDPDTRCVVLTGTGDRAFCAGLDLAGFAAGATPTDEQRDGQRAFTRFLAGEITVPIVGAANATAVAGGLELLLGCDVVVVSDAAQLGLPEVKRGLFAAGGGVFLGTRIPLAVALEMVLTGDPIDAARAHALGLVNAVVPAAAVLDTALDLARRIAANGPLAVAASKELVRLANLDAAAARERQSELHAAVFGSEDAKEGATAFIERRAPEWRGR